MRMPERLADKLKGQASPPQAQGGPHAGRFRGGGAAATQTSMANVTILGDVSPTRSS